jgi:hypothetical protein
MRFFESQAIWFELERKSGLVVGEVFKSRLKEKRYESDIFKKDWFCFLSGTTRRSNFFNCTEGIRRRTARRDTGSYFHPKICEPPGHPAVYAGEIQVSTV